VIIESLGFKFITLYYIEPVHEVENGLFSQKSKSEQPSRHQLQKKSPEIHDVRLSQSTFSSNFSLACGTFRLLQQF